MEKGYRSLSSFPGFVTLTVCLTFALLGLGVTPANAQVSKGSISGSVTDPQGAAVLGASVRVVSKDSKSPNKASARSCLTASKFPSAQTAGLER